ncbi:vesicle coat component [Ophidiomyces ophidiicola]|nr:vesicle coat component [Ophidiomyces ophidiicola]
MAEKPPPGYDNSPLRDTLRLGSWNPAHRPDCENGQQQKETRGSLLAVQAPESLSGPAIEPEQKICGLPLHSSKDTNNDGGTVELTPDHSEDATPFPNGTGAPWEDLETRSKSTTNPTINDSLIDSVTGLDVETRTNSFPDVHIDSQKMVLQPEECDENVNHSAGNETVSSECQLHTGPTIGANSPSKADTWGDAFTNSDDADFFTQISSQTNPVYIPPESESRFDEGVPLVSNIDVRQEDNPPHAIESFFAQDDPAGDADFFSSQKPCPGVNRPLEFQRKSTSDVLQQFSAENEPPSNVSISTVTSPSTAVAHEHSSPLELTNTPNVEVGEEELAERWKALLEDDDMLIDDDNAPADEVGTMPIAAQHQAASLRPSPTRPDLTTPPRSNIYTPHQPSTSEIVGDLPAAEYFPSQASTASAVESFSNRSKAGYQSPYDLPFDIRPKHTAVRAAPRPIGIDAPPSSISMSGQPPQSSSFIPPPPVGTGYLPAAGPPPPTVHTAPPPSREPIRAGSFFEELPPVSRSQPPTRDRYNPQANNTTPQTISAHSAPTPSFQEPKIDPYSKFQLQPPTRLDPYSTLSAPPSQAQTPSSSRYSPQPPQPSTKSIPYPRYSPAPPQPPTAPVPPSYVSQSPNVHTSVNTLPFQPRTSSPLAHNEPSKSQFSPPRKQDSFPNPAASSLHSRIPQAASDSQIIPPKRSMTQSPGKMAPFQSNGGPMHKRPASAHGPRLPVQHAPFHQVSTPGVYNNVLDVIEPTDGQENDPLGRWKGAPIFKFGFGGTVISTFPRYIPRYATGQVNPRMKPNPGDLKTHSAAQFLTEDELSTKFPGPLKSKSKKKEVLIWLSAMISSLENNLPTIHPDLHPIEEHREDTIILWKVMKVLVEHDGVLGGAAAEASLQSVFHPNLNDSKVTMPSLSSQVDQSTSNYSATGQLRAEPTGGLGVDAIYNNLVAGDREKAVWDAVDRRLWGHAMLISSTMEKSVWGQVVREFIRREVRSLGQNTESLSALYEVFAGNFEESIDELVPPSARAGLQMVSMHAGPGPTKNALEGLNKWRDTVNLILKNRSSQDHQALLALGKLLASYGRVAASHVCCLISGTTAGPIFGGINDPQANVVLLGADHWRHPSTFMVDPYAYMLTEVYEFATSMLAASPSPILPHLQPFKLQHAASLTEHGHKAEAQQYCEIITANVASRSAVKSPYFHQHFITMLDELSYRLRQAPTDGSSSWMSKPSMEKVSGSMWAKFNSFVAGDDNEISNGAGKAGDGDIGPFAKITGTPPVSRPPSVAETYGSYFPQAQAIPTTTSSRYAPNSQYAPYSSPEQSYGRRSFETQPSPGSTLGRSYSHKRRSQDPSTPLENTSFSVLSGSIYSPPTGLGATATSSISPYAPLAPVEESYSPLIQSPTSEIPAMMQNSTGSFGISQTPPDQSLVEHQGINGEQISYQPPTYDPPSLSTGYEPPSYTPYSPEEENPGQEAKPRQSFMDGDSDGDGEFMARAKKLAEKARLDREAAEAVKRAAEEDAKRPAASEKKGWFTGWFGKKENPNSSGPVRADLGDDNSFYFNKELNRWVNKNDPGGATAVAAPPPPPKGSTLSSQSASVTQTPTTPAPPNGRPGPSPIPGSVGSAPSTSIMQLPTPPLVSMPPPSGSPRSIPRSVSAGAPTGPPSRPGTSLSTASSIDDLLGPPQPRKAGTLKAKKKGRGYIDVMAK